MTTFYARCDGPSLRLYDRVFKGGIEVICQPTYGRVLFLHHYVEIVGCWFEAEAA